MARGQAAAAALNALRDAEAREREIREQEKMDKLVQKKEKESGDKDTLLRLNTVFSSPRRGRRGRRAERGALRELP